MSSPPAIPEEANRRMVRGKFLAKEAKDEAGFLAAAKEIEEALRIAPWWSLGYYNLGLVLDGAGRFDEALRSFKLYLAAEPDSPDAAAVQNKIYELELKAERR